MYWTPAKMLLLADVGEYSFTNTAALRKKLTVIDISFITYTYFIRFAS